MAFYESVDLDQLRIWSDNPRYGYTNGLRQIMGEKDAINALIDVVSEPKMYALAADIIERGGLLPNTIPTIVESKGLLLVYDGNRRISCCKMLRNPKIIEFDTLRAKIIKLVKNKNLDFLKSVTIFKTDESAALKIMDATHLGERGGAGLIAWDAFNRDISLKKRGLMPAYPVAYQISETMGFQRKNDFKIPYTDLQRLFSSKPIKQLFGLAHFSFSERAMIDGAITAFLSYKDYSHFQSFSRQFNITAPESDSDGPIQAFCDWYRNSQRTNSLYIVNVPLLKRFEDDSSPVSQNDITVIEKETESTFTPSAKDLDVLYVRPDQKAVKDFIPTVCGKWLRKATYKGCEGHNELNVRQLNDPVINFGETRKLFGNSVNLRHCVISAFSSHLNDVTSTLTFKYCGNGRQPKVVGDVLTNENEPGNYSFSFTIDNEGVQYSVEKDIIILPLDRVVATPGLFTNYPFVTTFGVQLTFSQDVWRLADEINQSWKNQLYFVCACSVRAVLELAFGAIDNGHFYHFSSKLDDIKGCLDELTNYLVTTNPAILTGVCGQCNSSFRTECNFLSQIDSNRIAASLHLGAHKSLTILNTSDLFEICNKTISRLLQIIEVWIR